MQPMFNLFPRFADEWQAARLLIHYNRFSFVYYSEVYSDYNRSEPKITNMYYDKNTDTLVIAE